MPEPCLPIVREVIRDPSLVELVDGLFGRLGLHVTDTGERCVIEQTGGGLTLHEGDGPAEFTVELERWRVERIAREADAAGPLGEVERFRVVAQLFTAATAATLRQRRLASPVLRRLSGAEPLIHVRMMSPDPAAEPDVTHTLAHVARQWLVIPGLHGEPGRTFRMSLDDTLTYQRKASHLMRHESIGEWLAFSKWYRAWRPTVSRKGRWTEARDA